MIQWLTIHVAERLQKDSNLPILAFRPDRQLFRALNLSLHQVAFASRLGNDDGEHSTSPIMKKASVTKSMRPNNKIISTSVDLRPYLFELPRDHAEAFGGLLSLLGVRPHFLAK